MDEKLSVKFMKVLLNNIAPVSSHRNYDSILDLIIVHFIIIYNFNQTFLKFIIWLSAKHKCR